MPRQPSFPPYPRAAHSSGQARIKVQGQPYYLGVHGSAASHARYAQLHGQWIAGTLGKTEPEPVQPSTMADLVALFLADADRRRRKTDGAPKTEVLAFQYALTPVLKLHGSLPAAAFGTVELEAIRDSMPGLGWCRSYANRHLTRIKTFARWCEAKKLLPPNTFATLLTVPGLAPGEAEEADDVPPVPEDDLVATLPHLGPVVADVVQVQLRSGARPGEALSLRPADLIRTGRVEIEPGCWLDAAGCWLVNLAAHKTAWRGHRRWLIFGPQAQAALQPYLAGRPETVPLFSPREAATRWLTELGRNVEGWLEARKPRDRYGVGEYRHAVQRACDRADREAKVEARREGLPVGKDRLVQRWSPGQLRHNAATLLASEFGPEVARIVLGHRDLGITRTYVADDYRKAIDAMRRVG